MSAPAKAPSRPHARNEWANERHVYEPHFVGLPPLGQYFREVWRRREFARELARTNLRAKHFDTVFGALWMVLNPLLLASVYFLLVDIIRRGHRPPGTFAHVVAGIFAYYFITGSIRDGVKSVTKGDKLILNSAFPRILLPLSDVINSFIRFVPMLLVYVPIHLLSHLPTGLALLWIFPLVAIMTVMATGFTVAVAAVQVYFRDLASFLPYMLRIWLYISPVLYLPSQVPGGYKWLLDVNPLGQLLTAWSDVVYRGVAPGWHSLVIACAWAGAAFVFGTLFFISREREFAVRL